MNSQKITEYNKKKKKKHDKILVLVKSKLSDIETLVSQALIDMEISHEEFITILKEKDKYEKMKDNLRSENEKTRNHKIKQYKIKDLSQQLLSILCHQKRLFFSCVCIKWF